MSATNLISKKILLVDDEPDILEFMEYNLKKEAYQVFTAKNGIEALDAAKKENPHLILMDIMMPEMDGIEACRLLRNSAEFNTIMIAFLTARGEDYSQVAGFEAGGDDYITKPIQPRMLLSRIGALLKRSRTLPPSATKETLGEFELDRKQYLVKKGGLKIALPRKEFELFALITSKPGKVYTRVEIMSKIWGTNLVVGDRTIEIHIWKLREKLGEDCITTVKGIGYKFEVAA